MKVLIVVRTLKIGGMERVAVNLADAFAEQGHESHLMYFKPRPPQLAPSNEQVNVHHFALSRAMWASGVGGGVEMAARLFNSVLRKSYFLLSGWWGGKLFRREIRRLERQYGAFDRIIFRGIGTFETVWSFQDPRACYVLENIVNPTPGHAAWLERLKARCLFHKKHLVTVSHGVEKQIATTMQALEVEPLSLRTITNPCPLADIQNAMRDDFPERPSSPYLLNVARLVPQKNHDLLLRAYAKMQTPLPLVIVGEGPLRNELEALAIELGIAENVTFAGRLLNPYPWMHHARLFILSSAHEGLGIVLLEALACQTPVVSVDCPGGVRDIMSGELEAYLCEMTPEALAARVDTVLDANGYAIDERWLERFSPAHITSAFFARDTCAMISANIITFNEEANIADCIASARQVCDDVVVVDSGSQDRTTALARELGANVVQQPYLGDGIQKNIALAHVKYDWVLSLDADERLTPQMVEAIQRLDLATTKHDAFAFRRRNMIGSRWIRVCGWYPDYCIRLYNRHHARFADVKQHASVGAANPQRLDADIVHYSFANLGQLFAKPGRNFSGRAAKIMFQKGKRANAFSPFLHGLNAFVRKYIFQRGFMGGVDGMTVAISAGLNSYLKYAKLLEYQRDPKVLEAEDFNKVW